MSAVPQQEAPLSVSRNECNSILPTSCQGHYLPRGCWPGTLRGGWAEGRQGPSAESRPGPHSISRRACAAAQGRRGQGSLRGRAGERGPGQHTPPSPAQTSVTQGSPEEPAGTDDPQRVARFSTGGLSGSGACEMLTGPPITILFTLRGAVRLNQARQDD